MSRLPSKLLARRLLVINSPALDDVKKATYPPLQFRCSHSGNVLQENCTLGGGDSSIGIRVVVTKVLHCRSWLLVSGSSMGVVEGQQTQNRGPCFIDVVPIAPYNERNQLFGESRWTLN